MRLWRLPLLGMLLLLLSGSSQASTLENLLKYGANYPLGYIFRSIADPAVSVPVHTSFSRNGAGISNLFKETLQFVLEMLPLDHIRWIQNIIAMPMNLGNAYTSSGKEQAAGLYVPSGDNIFMDTSRIKNNPDFQRVLSHEVGHGVQAHMLSAAENAEWVGLHQISSNPSDFVSSYARDGSPSQPGAEDFAESYRRWITRSREFEGDAVLGVLSGHTALLQKYLFISSLFVHSDGTIDTYNVQAGGEGVPSESSSSDQKGVVYLAFVGSDDGRTKLDRHPYIRTENQLFLGQYIYDLFNDVIVAIHDRNGYLIQDGLAISLPEAFMNRVPMSGDPLPVNSSPSPVPDQVFEWAPNNAIVPQEPTATTSDTATLQFVSPQAPHDYVSLMSPEGQATLQKETSILSPEHMLTQQDAALSHGNFVISPNNTH